MLLFGELTTLLSSIKPGYIQDVSKHISEELRAQCKPSIADDVLDLGTMAVFL